MTDSFDVMFADLPDPERDEMPPPVQISEEGAARAAEEKAVQASFLKPKKHTEARAQYVLGRVLGCDLKKDGDWKTTGGGRTFFRKRTADLVGSTRGWHTYVEVKGISPGNNFNLARLDKGKEPTQFERLSEKWKHGDLVMLALGWWIAPAAMHPIMVQQKSRQVRRWIYTDLRLELDVIRWDMFLEVYKDLGRRSIRFKDGEKLFPSCRVFKSSGRWRLHDDHWWHGLVEYHNPKFVSRLGGPTFSPPTPPADIDPDDILMLV